MAEQPDLFNDFPSYSKNEWLDKVIRDLKGKSPEELNWPLSEEITLAPFYHPDDKIPGTGLTGDRQGNSWEIGVEIRVRDFQEANVYALQALEGGAGALYFVCEHVPSGEEDIQILLKDIELGYISVHFSGPFSKKNLPVFLQAFDNLVKKKNQHKEALRGSFLLPPEKLKNAQLFKSLIDFKNYYPAFGFLWIDLRKDFSTVEFSAVRELTAGLTKARQVLRLLGEHDVPASQTRETIRFSFAVGNNYLVEIAKFRAFKLLWANLLKAFDLGVNLPAPVFAFQAPGTLHSDTNQNMIQTTTQAMSAVIGGVDQLFLLPADIKTTEPTSLTRRIARNVQHILKMESYLDKVADPAGGSYYLEKLTLELADKAWKAFQKIK